MAVENTENGGVSSIPEFMQNSGAADEAKAKAEKAAAKEDAAQAKDALEGRVAAVTKATIRTVEIADYVARITTVVGKTLPEMIAGNPLGQTLDNFIPLETAVEALDKKVSELKQQIAYAREVSFPARLDAEESRNFTSSDTGHQIIRTARVFASIVSEKLEDAYKWLRANELGPLIKETVNSSSLSGAAKELLENGKELPDDLFRVHTKDGVSIRKKKG